jgi:hypothetical protein
MGLAVESTFYSLYRFTPLRDDYYPDLFWKINSHNTVIFRLGYKNKSVNAAKVSDQCLFWEQYKTHESTVRANCKIS